MYYILPRTAFLYYGQFGGGGGEGISSIILSHREALYLTDINQNQIRQTALSVDHNIKCNRNPFNNFKADTCFHLMHFVHRGIIQLILL
jgi:hypothetical protein